MKLRLTLLLAIASLHLLGCKDQKPDAAETEPSSVTSPVADAGASASKEATEAAEKTASDVEVVPLQHGSLLLRSGDLVVAIDPVTSALDAADRELPKADVVFVTHIHGDHLDPAAIARLRREGAPVVVPKTVADEAGEALPTPTIMDNGETMELLDGRVEAEAIPMYNLKRERENGEPYHVKGEGNGYVLTIGGERIYVSGDTECTREMKALEDIDMAFVCMNLPYTMVPEEAVECAREFRPDVLIPYHYRGQDPTKVATMLSDVEEVEVRLLDWYPESE